MNQLDFRTRPDGVIEYRYQIGASPRRGRWELWEPVAIHAAKHMRIPPEYLVGLRAEGYTGGPFLIDLLNAEGWLVEREDYLELAAQPALGTGAKALPENEVARERGLQIARGNGGNPQHTMSSEMLLRMLHAVKNGADPERVYADAYAAPTTEHEHPE